MRRLHKIDARRDLIMIHGQVFAIKEYDISGSIGAYIEDLPRSPYSIDKTRLTLGGIGVGSLGKFEDDLEVKVMKLLTDLEKYGKHLSKFIAAYNLGTYDVDLEMLQWMNEAREMVNKK